MSFDLWPDNSLIKLSRWSSLSFWERLKCLMRQRFEQNCRSILVWVKSSLHSLQLIFWDFINYLPRQRLSCSDTGYGREKIVQNYLYFAITCLILMVTWLEAHEPHGLLRYQITGFNDWLLHMNVARSDGALAMSEQPSNGAVCQTHITG